MVNSNTSSNKTVEWLRQIDSLLPVPVSVAASWSEDKINAMLEREGLPPLWTDLKGAPLNSRAELYAWYQNQRYNESHLSQSSRPVTGGNGSTDRDGSNLGQEHEPDDNIYNGGLRNDTDVQVPDTGTTGPVIGDPLPYPPDQDIIDPDTGEIYNPYDAWQEDQANKGWLSGLFGGFEGLGLGSLIKSLISKYTDATVTGGEEIRHEWDLSKMESANQFSAQQAEISRDWQEEMYTKYNSLSGKIQQAQEAGVNPLFAVTGNSVSPMSTGSSSPSGAVASGSGQKSTSDLLSSLSSLIGLKSLKSQIAKTDAETQQIQAQTDISLKKLGPELANIESSTSLNLQKVIESATSIEKIKSDINLNTHHAEMFAEQVQYLIAQANYINAIREPDRRAKAAHAVIAEWKERNKEIFKGLEVGTDVISTLSDIGLGIFNAKTSRMFADK